MPLNLIPHSLSRAPAAILATSVASALALTLAIAPAAAAAAASSSASSSASPSAASGEHPSVKRPTSLPPSADLLYAIKVRQKGMALAGEARLSWRHDDGKYALAAQTKVPLFGVVLDSKSDGLVDDFGLAPQTASEKRYRKEATTVTFKRDAKTISFSESDLSYPIKGGEQDRTSAPWQLAAVARAAPEKFTPGSEWVFFVAGRRDAEAWTFKVVNQEAVQTGQGEVNALHLVKQPPAEGHGHDQQIDIWLAPSLEWYPVRIRLVDNDSDFIDQTLDKVTAVK